MEANRESLVLYFRDPPSPVGDTCESCSCEPALGRVAEWARRYAESPEGRALGEPRWVEIFLEHAALYYDADESMLTPQMVREIVFDLFPRHVTAPPSEASSIVAELRLFFVFLARELESKTPFACAHALDGRADDKLEAALADRDRFGFAKSLVMAGLDEGFDINTVEGLAAWLDRANSREQAAASVGDPTERRARRKAQRRARRRNR